MVWFINSNYKIHLVKASLIENQGECYILVQLMSLCVRKPTICICENKDADQLRSNCEADQRLCFRHTDSTIPLLLIFKVSSF